ncbi:MAG TPA: hypothetical protein VKU82_10925 [Planctomycetaceae bacterium]|nr:hypothetical protein [Planctomycetaceae bacterium]
MPHVDTPQSRCRLGVARCDITPPVGIYHRMWGAATHERAAGIHRPLTATAIAFSSLESRAREGRDAAGLERGAQLGTAEQPGASADGSGDGEQILIAVDHCIFFGNDMESLLDAISRRADVGREKLLIVFSHTHAAGLINTDRAHLPGGDLIAPYLEELGAKLADIVRQTRLAARPATLVYGAGRCAMAAHRDFFDEAMGGYVCGYDPQGPADDTVLVARAVDDDGRTMATFVNYACHPTTLAWQNQLISPDFPGAMREIVEAAIDAPCVFLQGASGDLGPREGFVGDVSLADRNGRQLGFAALAALEALPAPATRFEYAGAVVSGATIGTWRHAPLSKADLANLAKWRLERWTIDLAYRPGLPTVGALTEDRARWELEKAQAQKSGKLESARDAHAMIERADRQLARLKNLPPGAEFPLPATMWSIGGGIWLGVEAELYQLLQCALRERFPETPIVVMTLANGARPTYLPTQQAYETGVYPETIALLARGSLERLIETIGDRIAAWRGDLSK